MALLRRIVLTLPLFLLIVGLLGCGGSKKANCLVHGKVTYKGAPVTGGTISFNPTEEGKGNYVNGFNIKPDGTYETTGMMSGDYIVTIDTESLNPKAKPKGDPKMQKQQDEYRKAMMDRMGKGGGTPTEAQGTYVKLPDKFREKDKSGLSVKLSSGKNEKNFDLAD